MPSGFAAAPSKSRDSPTMTPGRTFDGAHAMRGYNIGRIESARRHAQHAGEKRNEGAHPGREPSEKDALVPVPRHKGLASGDQVRVTVHRPGFENGPAVTMTDPEGEAVSDDRARRRRCEKRPELNRPGGRQGADRDDRGRARDNHADDRDAFRKRQEKHRRIGEIRMRCDERGDGERAFEIIPTAPATCPGSLSIQLSRSGVNF